MPVQTFYRQQIPTVFPQFITSPDGSWSMKFSTGQNPILSVGSRTPLYRVGPGRTVVITANTLTNFQLVYGISADWPLFAPDSGQGSQFFLDDQLTILNAGASTIPIPDGTVDSNWYFWLEASTFVGILDISAPAETAAMQIPAQTNDTGWIARFRDTASRSWIAPNKVTQAAGDFTTIISPLDTVLVRDDSNRVGRGKVKSVSALEFELFQDHGHQTTPVAISIYTISPATT